MKITVMVRSNNMNTRKMNTNKNMVIKVTNINNMTK